MSGPFEAIFEQGILRPLTPLGLPDQSHVKLTIDSLGATERLKRPTEIVNARGDFETQLELLLFDGPSLPADFSRADIYADHD